MVGDLIDAGMVDRDRAPSGTASAAGPGTAVSLSGERVAARSAWRSTSTTSPAASSTSPARCGSDVHRLWTTGRPRLWKRWPDLRKLCHRGCGRSRRRVCSIAGATLAVPGPVDRRGRLHSAPNLGWRDVRVGELLDLPSRSAWTTRPTSPRSASSGSAPVRGRLPPRLGRDRHRRRPRGRRRAVPRRTRARRASWATWSSPPTARAAAAAAEAAWSSTPARTPSCGPPGLGGRRRRGFPNCWSASTRARPARWRRAHAPGRRSASPSPRPST